MTSPCSTNVGGPSSYDTRGRVKGGPLPLPNFVLLSSQKPAFGKPCNGCGFCCQNESCSLAVELLKCDSAPCAALEFDNGKYRCGLCIRPSHYLGLRGWMDDFLAPTFRKLLGSGMGCDSEA